MRKVTMESRATFPERAGAGADELPPDQLRSCVRDLLSLLGLPALLRDREPREILEKLLGALEASIPIELACAHVAGGADPIDVIRIRGGQIPPDAPEWQTAVARCVSPDIAVIDSPIGALRVAHAPLGYHATRGWLSLASTNPDFPTPVQSVLINAAASVSHTALDTARLLGERAEASNAKDEFLAMLGHELRNPLAPIVTALQLMRMKGAATSREFNVIARQVKHLIRLVDDLLDVARVTRGKIELYREVLDLSQILARAIETASPMIERSGHRLQMDVAPQLAINADPTRMAQVFANLLTNAAKYTPFGGLIEVTARPDGDHAVVEVKDSGVGISKELQHHIFDIFVQGRRSRDRSEGGLGIGLALVKNLVLLHGGEVAVLSEGPGAGATFVVRLPLTQSASVIEAAQGSRIHADLGSRRVLVVDDNRDAAELLADLLRAAGCEAAVCVDSVTALATAESFLPHVMVLDIGLPLMDGYELATAVRQRLGSAAPRMIAVTGYGQERDRNRSHEAGFEAHFVKPVDPGVLIDAIGADAPPDAQAPNSPW